MFGSCFHERSFTWSCDQASAALSTGVDVPAELAVHTTLVVFYPAAASVFAAL
jgi:hypothetical protein